MNSEQPKIEITKEEIKEAQKEMFMTSGGMKVGQSMAEYKAEREALWNKMQLEESEANKAEDKPEQGNNEVLPDEIYLDELQEEEQNKTDMRISQIREGLGIPEVKQKIEGINNEDYEKFRVKNGETDVGVYWYEYGNAAAKKLKESGKMVWGKERIYFDIPLGDMEKLRDLSFIIAKEQKIPLAFKHLDVSKTDQIDLKPDSETTRFVANFASVEDAKRFYEALKLKDEYKQMKSDRNMDYHGLNLDGVANYASGYREQREPLKRIVETAQRNNDGTYSYMAADGERKMTITEVEYKRFADQLKAIPNPEEVWGKA